MLMKTLHAFARLSIMAVGGAMIGLMGDAAGGGLFLSSAPWSERLSVTFFATGAFAALATGLMIYERWLSRAHRQ
jgi:hypothetical protein